MLLLYALQSLSSYGGRSMCAVNVIYVKILSNPQNAEFDLIIQPNVENPNQTKRDCVCVTQKLLSTKTTRYMVFPSSTIHFLF